MTDDRELERYLKGGSKLSQRYREASRQAPPKELDDAILAHARAEARRKRGAMRWLTPVALAASMVLGVNLAWNVYRNAPLPEAAKTAAPAAAPAPEPKAEADALQAAKAEAATQAMQQQRAEASRE